MGKKLWHKPGQQKLDQHVEEFLASDDALIDVQLAEYDIQGSLGHAYALYQSKLLSMAEYQKIKIGLQGIFKKAEQDKIKISAADEDIHTVVEEMLYEAIGSAAGKLHTCRSRNDQVLTDVRLYSKAHLKKIMQAVLETAEQCVTFADNHQDISMPGYTHMQPAMPSSVGLWADLFAENLLANFDTLLHAYKQNDRLPLGSAAGYGVPIAYSRQAAAEALGFSAIQENYVSCQNSRGQTELLTIAALHQVMLTLNRLAADLLVFTMREFSFFSLPDTFLTGSSIMPQKKNYDVLELLRAKQATTAGAYTTVSSIIQSLPSGYNRDYQELKKPLLGSFTVVLQSLDIASLILQNLQVNTSNLEKAHYLDLAATQQAYELVQQGIPFREAYQQVGKIFLDKPTHYNRQDMVLPEIPLEKHIKKIQKLKEQIKVM